MTYVERFLAHLASRGDALVMVRAGTPTSAADLLREAATWRARLVEAGVGAGSVVGVEVDDSASCCPLFVALMELSAIVAPVGVAQGAEIDALLQIAQATHVVRQAGTLERRPVHGAAHALLERLRSERHAGLVIFTSGSTGAPKGMVHDLERLLKKFTDAPRPGLRSLQFLPLFHMGGWNTWLSAAWFGGLAVIPAQRRPAEVAEAIAASQVELFPATPSFLRYFVAVGAHEKHDMSSVRLVTYGAEVSPDGFLEHIAAAFPNARFQQTYGLSEVGVLRAQSRDSGSLWLKVGGTGYEVRVVDGILHIRTEYAMLGYLNAPSPFDADGWLNTQDAVLVDGEWLRILGRTSELINVAGEKVFPAEVEAVIMQAPNVTEAVCFGEPDKMLGQRIGARVSLKEPEDPDALRTRLRTFCLGRLSKFKVPVRFEVVDRIVPEDALKKKRTAQP